jgi:antitoxin YefM
MEIMRTANYSELRNNLKSYLDGVINDNEPLIVHRAGNESVVVISLEEYNSIKETEYIMRSPAMMDIIRRGDEEIKNGGGTSVDIEELWK